MLSPSLPDGPSLVALRAFESAARCGSFSRAAEELHVTPAAVAQHVKSLEAWARQPLFTRTARGVILNEAGIRVRPALTDAFHRLAAVSSQLRDGNPHRRTVRVAALPAISELWLTPRLAELRAWLPNVDLAIHAVDRKPDIERDGFDVTAYYEPTGGPGDELILVAAPDVAADLQVVTDLDAVARLTDRTWESDWHTWTGPDVAQSPAANIEFTLFAMAVRAACDGQGALVGRRSLLGPFVDRGELVEPFNRRIATGDSISMRRRQDPALAELDGWSRSAGLAPTTLSP